MVTADDPVKCPIKLSIQPQRQRPVPAVRAGAGSLCGPDCFVCVPDRMKMYTPDKGLGLIIFSFYILELILQGIIIPKEQYFQALCSVNFVCVRVKLNDV